MTRDIRQVAWDDWKRGLIGARVYNLLYRDGVRIGRILSAHTRPYEWVNALYRIKGVGRRTHDEIVEFANRHEDIDWASGSKADINQTARRLLQSPVATLWDSDGMDIDDWEAPHGFATDDLQAMARLWLMRDEIAMGLDRSRIAIDDWLNVDFADFCDAERVEEARQRINEMGTVAYIADVQQQNRDLLKRIAEVEDGDK